MLSLLTVLCLATVAYVYVGYPLLAFVLGLLIRYRPASGPITPTVDLIIAAYNEEDVIADKLRNCMALDYPRDRLSIVVVADGSDDGTAEIARRFDGVTVLHQPQRRGKCHAINRAVQHGCGEIIVFSDANAFYGPRALADLVEGFADRSVGCISGAKQVLGSGQVGRSERSYWSYESLIRRAETACGSTVGVVGEINSVRRSLFSPIPADIINDDVFIALVALRAGLRVLFEPRAISLETAAPDMEQEAVRRRRIIAGRWLLACRPDLWTGLPLLPLFALMSHKFMRLLLPGFMAAALLLNVAACLTGAGVVLWVTAVLQVAVYGAALAAAWRPARAPRLFRLCHFVLRSNVEVMRGMMLFASGGASPVWAKAARTPGVPA